MFIPDTLRSCMVEPDVSTYLQAPSVGQVLELSIKVVSSFFSKSLSSLLYLTDLSCCARDIRVFLIYLPPRASVHDRETLWIIMISGNDDVTRWPVTAFAVHF